MRERRRGSWAARSVVGLAVGLLAMGAAWPAAAWWGNLCFVARTTAEADVFGARSGQAIEGPTTCRQPEDYSVYATTAVWRDGVRLRPVVAYAYLRRGAATKTATFLPFPDEYTAESGSFTWRCAGSSVKGPTPPTTCTAGSRGMIRLDVTFGNRGTPYPQLVVVAKYRTGLTVGTITTAGPMRAGFASGWEAEELERVIAGCLGVGQRCEY